MLKILKLLLISFFITLTAACSSYKTIDFSKEIIVSFSGSEGNSEVTLSTLKGGAIEGFKEAALVDIKRLEKGVPLNPEMDKLHAISAGYFYTCTTDSDLSSLHNGDVVTYTCHINPNTMKEYNLKEVNPVFSINVSGLN